MKCPRCQHENEASAKFCEECAAPLARTCGNCARQLSPTAKFCPECAHPTGLAPEAPTAPRFTSPEGYTPKHLAERILNSKAALEGERKHLTVLFADLKGSMELLADRDPEEARKILDPVLELMMEAVHRYEGTVNQVMGDGIMALFGAPVTHEDHAVRACYAALDMQAAIRRYAEDVRRNRGLGGVVIRAGLNSGEVVVRAIGSDLRMDYTAVGQTTHLAARMEQLASPGTTLLTADTRRLVEGYISVKPLGPVPIKGMEAAVEVYEMTGAGPLRSRFQAAAVRGLTRFVGRETELEQLRQSLSRAAAEHGQVVAIVGEPGVGKSRLVWEVTHSPRTHGWLIVQASSVSYGKATPYLAVIDLLKAYFQIEDKDDARQIREKVTSKLLTLDRAAELRLAAFLALLDGQLEDPQWQALDPPQRRQQTLEGVKRLLLRESQVQPLLVVFEDLHWIDTETQALLDSLVDNLPTARMLLLVNYRPEYQHTWGGKTYYTQIRLDALPPESAEELLQALLGRDPALHPLKPLLIEQTEGNPFFLEEAVRTLVETTVLAGERGAYRLERSLTSIQVPATVQAVLAARIDRLSPEDKRVLQEAAVIGKDVPFVLLQAIAEQHDDALRRSLARLQAAEFLYETRLFPDLEYTFRHALTHEVAYASLLLERRRALHRRIVEAIETLSSDHPSQAEQLAQHAFRGEVWEKAVTYLRQAGAKAMARPAYREAVACFEQALAALRHLEETRERLEQTIDLHFDLRNSLMPLGEPARILRYLRETEPLARTLDDPRRLGWMSVYMSHALWQSGHPAEARTFSQRALPIAETFGDFPLQVATNYFVGHACYASGDYRGAEGFLRRVVQLLQDDRSRERSGLLEFPASAARSFLALSLAERGAFDEGSAHGQEGIRIAEAIDHPYSLIYACWALAQVYGLKGELRHAVRLLERSVALCHDWNITLQSAIMTGFLGYAHARSGRVEEGLALLHQALAALEPMGWRTFYSLLVVHMGEACLLADRMEDALTFAGRALTRARQGGQRGFEAYALRLLGEVAAHGDPSDFGLAEDYYRQALALADELRMRPLVAHCHLGLGKLYRRIGKRQEAHEHLTTATTLYREMDMLSWPEQAEAAMKALA